MAKAPPYAGVGPDIGLGEAGRAILRPLSEAAFGEVRAVLRGDDAEAVHDMRVALRRLRVALSTFRDCYPKKRLREVRRATRRIGRMLGAVRDADVHLAALQAALAAAGPCERTGLAHAIEALAAQRADALAAFADESTQFDGAGLAGLITSEESRTDEALRGTAPRILAKRLQRLLDRAGAALESGHAAALHAMRIEGKHLRYNLEFFRGALAPSADEAIDLLADLQERLGTIADLDGFGRSYGVMLAGLNEGDPRAAGLHARLTMTRRERERLLEGLRHRWIRGERPYPERLKFTVCASLASLSASSAS